MFVLNSLDLAKVTFAPVVSPGAKFDCNQILPLDEIYVPPMADNPVRKAGKNLVNIQKLTQSLSRGIQYDKMPPVVIKRSRIVNGKHYKYELVCGNHRFEALVNNGYDKWIFSIYQFGLNGVSFEDSIRTFQLMENDHAPALESSDEDISNIISYLIAHGSDLVKNTEDSIREYVETYCKNKHFQTKAKIVKQAVRKSGAYQHVVTYTAADAFKWIDENTTYSVAGKLDAKRKKFGWTVLEGYEYEYVVSAINKFAESGKQSYFVCHTKAPTEKMNLTEKRKRMLESFAELEDNLISVFDYYEKNGKFPWNVEGFLPQDHKSNEKEFIRLV
jgi:hypothetical protein